MACDICGTVGTSLTDLRSGYQTKDVKAICPECEKVINAELWKIQDFSTGLIPTLMRRFITAKKSTYEPVCGMKEPTQ